MGVTGSKTEQEAHAALVRLREELVARGVTLHPDKTRVTNVRHRGGFDFLGYQLGRQWAAHVAPA